jgi:hypothetical protein
VCGYVSKLLKYGFGYVPSDWFYNTLIV